MCSSIPAAPGRALLLCGLILCCRLAAADMQPQEQQHTGAQHVHRMRRSLLAESLVCDGQTHELSMPDAPYPEAIPFAPIVTQPFFACTRPKQGLDAESNGECGAAPRYECDEHVFEPVLYGSGQTPGIISPNNPVTISLKGDTDYYLTHAEWTAVDVGSAGARLRGVYGSGSDLSPVTINYAWAWNGRNAEGEFGPCSSCKAGQGIKVMNVTAIPGAGFRSLQLSQMFVNTQCAGASGGLNYDGLYWHGMKYSCVRPTCADTDLNTADKQRFGGCMPSTAYAYNPKAENNTILSVDSCCLPVTCNNVSPVKQPGQAFVCPPNREFDSSNAGARGPSVQTCCSKPATCDDIQPLSAPGVKYQCREETHEWQPQAAKVTPPTDKACCQARTCANYNPITSPGERFACPRDHEFDPEAEDRTAPDVATCCKPATCADVTPVSKPGTPFKCGAYKEFNPASADREGPTASRCCSQVATCGNVSPIRSPGRAFSCPADAEYDPELASVEEPSAAKCCTPATCGDVSPIRKPGTAFECPLHMEFEPSAVNATAPKAKACCKAATCEDTKPISRPGVRFECPADTEFQPAGAKTHPPSPGACCKVATCDNVSPIGNPGTRFACPAGSEFNPRAAVRTSPSTLACCTPATCENIAPISKPGRRYACPGNRQLDPEKLGNRMPSDESCCSAPNSCEDVTPVSEPGVQYKCPPYREFEPANAELTWPSEERCCSKVASCGDLHPITAPGTRFVCPALSEWNPTAANITMPDEIKCCKKATCGNMQPVSKVGVLFACPENTEYDPARTLAYPPRPESCCKLATCADIRPISRVGTRFVCPNDRELDPARGNRTMPSTEACCSKPATCGDTKPISAPGTAFVCPANRERDPSRANASPVNTDSCCSKVFTCGAIKPVSRPGRTYDCGSYREFDPAKNDTERISEGTCCSKPRTCGDFFPVTKPGAAFPCSNASEYNPSMSEAWPANEGVCCKARSCSDVLPVSSPGVKFTCPKQSEWDEAREAELKPSADTCCKHATCADLKPLSKPGVRFEACPPNMRYNLEADESRSPSVDTCCQSLVDVWVKKTVSPSTVQKAGSILLYRLEVGVTSNASHPADTVTMVEAMPEGLELVSVTELPDENACRSDESGVTCIWAKVPPGKSRFVTITVNASSAGVQPSIAAVTTASLDLDARNNKAAASVSVLGACCTPGPEGDSHCVETLPEACTGGFLAQSVCSQIDICSVAPEPPQATPAGPDALAVKGLGACCTEDLCTDSVPNADCSGTWSKGAACSDSKVQCGLLKAVPHLSEAMSKAVEAVEKEHTPTTNKLPAEKEGVAKLSAEVVVAAHTGACCNALSGACSDGIEEGDCAAPARWTEGGKCGPNQVCTGACCDARSGKCHQKTKAECKTGAWTLYKECKADTCPKPPGFVHTTSEDDEARYCIPKWAQCSSGGKGGNNKGHKAAATGGGRAKTERGARSMMRSLFSLTADRDVTKAGKHHVMVGQCCEGTTCQYTYDGCKAGRFVCKPASKCVHKDQPCGGPHGSHCCKGLTCAWDYSTRPGHGVCRKVDRCAKEGSSCSRDEDCCRGTRCKENGKCAAPVCWKRCSDYRCYEERKRDCEAMAAAAASA